MMDALNDLAKLQQDQRNNVELVSWSELVLRPPQGYLIKGLLDASTMSVIYGPSNSGKTFLALSMAVSVARGSDWCGRRVRQGAVVYVAGEGDYGVAMRLQAYRKFHRLHNLPPLFVVPHSLDLRTAASDAPNLIDRIKEIGNVSLVVIDTLARNLAGGNENASEDMGAFVANCDKIRKIAGAHVMVIHHSGKDAAKGARGHSSLKAATDTEIEVTQSGGLISTTIRKQRDGKTGQCSKFYLQQVELGDDEDGEAITSCVILPQGKTPSKISELTKTNIVALDIIRHCLERAGIERTLGPLGKTVLSISTDELRQEFKKSQLSSSDNPDTHRRQFDRIIRALNSLGILGTYGDFVWISDNPDKSGQMTFLRTSVRTDPDSTLEGCPLSGSENLSACADLPAREIPYQQQHEEK